jgi:NCS1 family nucleobase:cation symporter-1
MDIKHSYLYNEDLAPVPQEKRTWGMWNIAALWIGMSVCVTTYMLAANLMKAGMKWWQALLTITLGNFIVYIPMVLNAHAGTKYGIPFPVLLRSSFGVVGANIPAMMRALVACGWFGIQTWIGGQALYLMGSSIFGYEMAPPVDPNTIFGASAGQFAAFLLFWAINIAIILIGIESIKWLETWSAPLLLLIGGGLLWWGWSAAGGFGVMFSDKTVGAMRGGGDFDFWIVFFPQLTAVVGYWATLSLNIPDFTRYAKSQKDQALGQLVGLPTTMALFAFIGIAVTAATVVVYGEAIWDPTLLMAKFMENPMVVLLATIALSIATLSTNLAANVVGPANDISNLRPSLISFRTGAVITGIVGILMMPWKLLADPTGYVFTWLIAYSALLGAVGGVMIADYYLVRRAKLNADALYDPNGEYAYGGSGCNWRAILALAIGIAPNVPGFLHNTGVHETSSFFVQLYTYAWFVSFGLAMAAHVALSKVAPPSKAA